MGWSRRAALILTLAGGRWGSREEAPARAEPHNIYDENSGPDLSGYEATTAPREPMAYLGKGLDLQVTSTIGGAAVVHHLQLEQAGIRIGDVPSLDHPLGTVKIDPLTLTTDGNADWAKVILDRSLRDSEGSPIQIFLEVHSVGDMNGRLDPGGSTATGTVLGRLQVGDRQVDVDFKARFRRPDADHLTVETAEPWTIDLHDLSWDRQLGVLAARLGAAVEPTIAVALRLDLERFDGPLPTFVRTPVTIQTMEEVRDRIDEEYDDFDILKYRLAQQGESDQMIKRLTPEAFARMQAAAAARRSGSPLPARPDEDEAEEGGSKQVTPATVEEKGGVLIIRDGKTPR